MRTVNGRCYRRSLPLVRFFAAIRCFSTAAALDIAVITGTTRIEGPPRPILGPRVASFIARNLERRGNKVTVIDPRETQLPLLQKPQFAYSKSQQPSELDELNKILISADAYVTVTPEYNHSPSPALLNILNHFGSSTFSFKPSAIVSYSAGQWGGTRAAAALRPFLSELGCLPVSAMVHFPQAHDILSEDGTLTDPLQQEKWQSYLDRCFSQLEWWGTAAKKERNVVDPFESSPSFQSSPSQRNAPK